MCHPAGLLQQTFQDALIRVRPGVQGSKERSRTCSVAAFAHGLGIDISSPAGSTCAVCAAGHAGCGGTLRGRCDTLHRGGPPHGAAARQCPRSACLPLLLPLLHLHPCEAQRPALEGTRMMRVFIIEKWTVPCLDSLFSDVAEIVSTASTRKVQRVLQ